MPKSFFTIITVALWFFSFAGSAVAATIYFDLGETTVGTSTFSVPVRLDSLNPINAINLIINIPASLELVDTSDGNSVINLWMDRPTLNDKNQLVFSGLIPGGFAGNGGKLIELSLRAKRLGAAQLSMDKESSAYLNNEQSSKENITAKPLSLIVISGKINPDPIADEDPPEPFKSEYVKLPQNGAAGSGEVWALAFATQDKGVGIDHYEIAQHDKRIDLDSAGLDSLSWQEAESPFILADQDLKSHVYVRAFDKNENYRTEMVGPQPAWYGLLFVIIIALIILGFLASRKRKA